MKILILGYSDLAKRKILPAIKKIKNLRFDIASVSKKKQDIGQDNWYNNYDYSINNTDAKIVYISLVNSKHYEYALKALKKNKNLIIDKPIALKLSQTKKLLFMAREKRLLISQALVFNYHNNFILLKKIIKKNKIKINNIIMQFYIPRPLKGNFKLSKKLGGGCFNDMAPYAAEVMRIFLNKKIIYYKLFLKNSKNINESFSIFAYSKNIRFNGFFSHNSEYKNNIHFLSSNSSIKLNRYSAPPSDLNLNIYFRKKNRFKKILVKKDDTFKKYLIEYFKALKQKKILFYHKRIIKDANLIEKIYKNKIII